MKATREQFSFTQKAFFFVRLWAVVLLLSASTVAQAHAARASNALYDRWASLSNEQLLTHGVDFLARQQADSALVCYTLVTERLGSTSVQDDDTERLIAALYNTGYIYSTFYNDYPKSFSFLQRALHLSESTHQTGSLPYIYNSLAGMYLLNAEMHSNATTIDEVMQLFAKGFATAMESREWSIAFVIFNNMVSAAVKYQRADLLAPQLQLLRTTKIPARTPMIDYIRLTGQGAEAYGKGDYAGAASFFAQADGKANSRWEYSAYYHALAVFNQAHALCRIGRYGEAKALLTAIERETSTSGDREVTTEVHQMLRECEAAMGNNEAAERYYVAYLKDRDSLLTSSRLDDVNRMRFLDEIGKMSQQVRQLTSKRRVQTLFLYGVGTLAAVVLTFLILLARKNRTLSERNRRLYQNNVDALRADADRQRIIDDYERQLAQLQQAVQPNGESPEAEHEKYRSSTLGEAEKQQLAARIKQILDTKTEEICSESFSLARLADLAGSNSRYVSQVVNEHFGRNFNALMSEYRIREACRRLNDHAHYGNLTIEGISRSVGFKSRSNFASVFRRQTGLSPSEYQRMSKEAE